MGGGSDSHFDDFLDTQDPRILYYSMLCMVVELLRVGSELVS